MTDAIKAALESIINEIIAFVKSILKVELPQINLDEIL